jgi:hypothetical protein
MPSLRALLTGDSGDLVDPELAKLPEIIRRWRQVVLGPAGHVDAFLIFNNSTYQQRASCR